MSSRRPTIIFDIQINLETGCNKSKEPNGPSFANAGPTLPIVEILPVTPIKKLFSKTVIKNAEIANIKK